MNSIANGQWNDQIHGLAGNSDINDFGNNWTNYSRFGHGVLQSIGYVGTGKIDILLLRRKLKLIHNK
jgi:hypothetical protein